MPVKIFGFCLLATAFLSVQAHVVRGRLERRAVKVSAAHFGSPVDAPVSSDRVGLGTTRALPESPGSQAVASVVDSILPFKPTPGLAVASLWKDPPDRVSQVAILRRI